MNRKKSNPKFTDFRVAILESLRVIILQEHYNTSMLEHLGIKKTYEQIASKYYWLLMYIDIKRQILLCQDYNTRKPNLDRNAGILQTIRCSKPFAILGTNLTRLFLTLKDRNKQIIVFIDHFTKQVEAVAIKEANAETIAKNLSN